MEKTFYKRYNLELVEENSEKYESLKIKDKKVSSTDIATEVNKVFKLNRKAEEYIILLCLNQGNYINGIFEISHGGVSSTKCIVANILKRALLVNSTKIILCHNHPSGCLKASKQDYELTDRIYNSADIIGLQLLDHIIIGKNDECISILNERQVSDNGRY